MVPPPNREFFTDSAAAAGTLIGLLFVVISLRTDSIFGDNASPGGRALAGSSFTGLVNAFFISLLAAIPNVNFGLVVVVMGAISLYNTAKLHRYLARSHTQIVVLSFSVTGYVLQLAGGVWLIIQPEQRALVDAISYAVTVSFAIALLRGWALLQGKHVSSPEN